MQHSNRVPILVTGGAGYIGSHTCKALYLCGFEPVTYDNLSLGHERNVQWGPLVKGDIRDASAVESACKSHGVVELERFDRAVVETERRRVGYFIR